MLSHKAIFYVVVICKISVILKHVVADTVNSELYF